MEISLTENKVVRLAGFGTFAGPLTGAAVARLKQIAKKPGMYAIIRTHFEVKDAPKKSKKKAG